MGAQEQQKKSRVSNRRRPVYKPEVQSFNVLDFHANLKLLARQKRTISDAVYFLPQTLGL